MAIKRHHGGIAIVLSFFVALVLTIMPLPDALVVLRPEWVVLTLVYWCFALSQRVGVAIAWVLGLLLDLLKGALLGQHALALVVVAFIAVKVHQRVRVYPMWQQILSIFALVLLSQLLVLWVNGLIGLEAGFWLFLLPALSSALLWPWLYLILRDLRRYFHVT